MIESTSGDISNPVGRYPKGTPHFFRVCFRAKRPFPEWQEGKAEGEQVPCFSRGIRIPARIQGLNPVQGLSVNERLFQGSLSQARDKLCLWYFLPCFRLPAWEGCPGTCLPPPIFFSLPMSPDLENQEGERQPQRSIEVLVKCRFIQAKGIVTKYLGSLPLARKGPAVGSGLIPGKVLQAFPLGHLPGSPVFT